jgi:hypothetical protein
MPGFWGDEGEAEQLPLHTKEQQSALKNYFNNGGVENSPLYQSGSSYLQHLLSGSPNATAEFNAPYLQQFQQQIIPGLSERFAGMGTGAGSLNSSAFNQTLAQAGTGLQSTLAQLRQQLMGQASQQALGYAQQPYSNLFNALNIRPYENIYKPATSGAGQSLLSGAGGAAAGFALGGPPGALLGGAAGLASGGR